MAQLPPIPYRTALLDSQRLVTRPWQQWLEALLVRVGGPGDVAALGDDALSEDGTWVPSVAMLSNRLGALEEQAFFGPPPVVDVEDIAVAESPSLAQIDALQQRVAALEMQGFEASLVAQLYALTAQLDALTESNTWTPTGNGVTLTVTSAFYIRIEDQITVQFDVTWATTADGGQARIESLPFIPRAGWFGAQSAFINDTIVYQPFFGDTSFIILYDDGVGIKTNANLSTLRVAGTYTYFR